ncbi:MAG: glycosyltransferase family 9 protein [Candidatus Cloacimonadaceae bacterium]|jgi:ADP-heptose:LPS heptosyltransferase
MKEFRINNTSKILMMYLTWFFWIIRKAFTRLSDREPKSVCVLYLSGLGDIVCDTMFFESLRERWPQAELTACFPAAFCDVQKDFFAFDRYIKHQSFWLTLKQLWSLQADLIIIPGWLVRNSLLAIFSNAKAIIGYVNDLTFSNRYLNSFSLELAGIQAKRCVQDMRKCHLSQRPMAISVALGLKTYDIEDLEIPRMKESLNHAVFHAGARFEGRRYSEKSFARIAEYLLEKGWVHAVYLIGASDDRAINLRIKSYSKFRTIRDKSGISLYQSFDLIRTAKIFVGNDSGPMHLAALSGVPTLGLLGPNFPHISGPLGKQSRYLFHEFGCSGCNQRGCDYSYRCIKAITTQEVIDALDEMMRD